MEAHITHHLALAPAPCPLIWLLGIEMHIRGVLSALVASRAAGVGLAARGCGARGGARVAHALGAPGGLSRWSARGLRGSREGTQVAGPEAAREGARAGRGAHEARGQLAAAMC